jgi:hypothetical protein
MDFKRTSLATTSGLDTILASAYAARKNRCAQERSCQEWLLHKLPDMRAFAFLARKGVKACQVPRGRLSTPVQA